MEETKEPEVEYSPETLHQFFKERKREEIKKVREVLESFKIDEKIIEAVVTVLKNS